MPISFIPYTATYGPLSLPGVPCQLWLDGADSSTITLSGSTVTQWRDKSGNKNNSTSCSATFSSSINGNTVLTNPVISGPITNSGSSVVNFFIVGTLAATGGLYDSMLALNAATITNYYAAGTLFACYYGGTNPPQYYAFMNGNLNNTPQSTVNTPFIFNAFQSGTTGTTYFNGNSAGAVGTAGNTFTYTNYYIGTCTGGPAWVGNIAEIIIYNTTLSTPQQQAIEGYLAQKWGLTANLPPGHPGLSQTYYNAKVYQPQISLKPAPYANYFPLSIGGCTFWLDASKDTTSSGSYITTIPDWSGSSITLLPYAANTISLAGNTLNGLSVYNFGTGMASNASFFWGTTFTQFVVVKGTGNWLSCTFNGTNYNNFIYAGNWNLMQVNIVPTTNLFAVNDSSVAQGTSVFTTTTGGTSAWTIFCLGYVNGSTQGSNYTLNGTSRTTQTGTPASGTPANYQFWLNGRGGSSFDTSLVAELIHFNVNLTTSQRQQVEGYLAWKWGITLVSTHPYYSAPPLQYTRGSILPAPTLNAVARLPPIVATGGTITFSGSYKIHTFTTVGTANFTITSPYIVQLQVLIVGGGGGGGGYYTGGGGGAGGAVLTGNIITPGVYTVVVGAGGISSISDAGSKGGDSSFNSTTGYGGGGGGDYTSSATLLNGGCGGGSGGIAIGSGIGNGTGSQGGAGGNSTGGQATGGGGGMGGNGASASIGGGQGGAGQTYIVGGTSYLVAGGGGGGAYHNGATLVPGGSGIGGSGGYSTGTQTAVGTSGATNTGSGGGGSPGDSVAGGNGGSGLVVIAYSYP